MKFKHKYIHCINVKPEENSLDIAIVIVTL